MSLDEKQSYFDRIAPQWDQWIDPEMIAARLRVGIDAFGIGPREQIVDIGCGTGNLTRVLLERLSDQGKVLAVDLSERMLEEARKKNPDPRAAFFKTPASKLPLGSGQTDRVICFSVWPHLEDPRAALTEFFRVLAFGGHLHIWHIDPKETINQIHKNAGHEVAHDLLVPAAELADMVRSCGFETTQVVDDDTRYLISARRPMDEK